MVTLNVLGHKFEILNLSNILGGTLPLPPLGAVYLFTKQVNGNHTILYVGETKNLDARGIKNHHKWGCLNQGNCFCIHPDADADSRKGKEEFIRLAYTPQCNDTPVKQNNPSGTP